MTTANPHWHHAPTHLLFEPGVFMVTAATYGKEHFFHGEKRLDLLHDRLHACAVEFGWQLRAWAVFPNHYHFVARSPQDPKTLTKMSRKLHMTTAKAVNEQDSTPGRKVWHQFWESLLTYDRSYYARLHYVHQNPVRHKVAQVANAYRWCSAGQFELQAERGFRRMVESFPIDALNVPDVE